MRVTRSARARPIGPCAGRACMPPAAARARNGRGRNRTRRRIRRRAHKARRRARSLVRRLTCCTSRRSAALATHTAPRLLAALPRTEAASAASSGWSSPPPTTADSSGQVPARARQRQGAPTGRCPPGLTCRERGRGAGGLCVKEEEDTRVGSWCDPCGTANVVAAPRRTLEVLDVGHRHVREGASHIAIVVFGNRRRSRWSGAATLRSAGQDRDRQRGGTTSKCIDNALVMLEIHQRPCAFERSHVRRRFPVTKCRAPKLSETEM